MKKTDWQFVVVVVGQSLLCATLGFTLGANYAGHVSNGVYWGLFLAFLSALAASHWLYRRDHARFMREMDALEAKTEETKRSIIQDIDDAIAERTGQRPSRLRVRQ